MKKIFLLTLFLFFFFAASAMALNLGTNITVFDGSVGSGTGQGEEDNETEPGMVLSQVWDLEGFFVNGNKIAMVGGFDFKNGVPGYSSYTSGDIFIDTDGTYGSSFVYNQGFNEVKESEGNFGFEYVIDIDWTAETYKVLEIDGDTVLKTSYFAQNSNSNPFEYVGGGTILAGKGGSVSLFGYDPTLSGIGGFSGIDGNNTQYAASLDLDSDLLVPGYTFHFTMGCGNDNLMGKYPGIPTSQSVPEPATMMLLGSGLICLALLSRQRFK